MTTLNEQPEYSVFRDTFLDQINSLNKSGIKESEAIDICSKAYLDAYFGHESTDINPFSSTAGGTVNYLYASDKGTTVICVDPRLYDFDDDVQVSAQHFQNEWRHLTSFISEAEEAYRNNSVNLQETPSSRLAEKIGAMACGSSGSKRTLEALIFTTKLVNNDAARNKYVKLNEFLNLKTRVLSLSELCELGLETPLLSPDAFVKADEPPKEEPPQKEPVKSFEPNFIPRNAEANEEDADEEDNDDIPFKAQNALSFRRRLLDESKFSGDIMERALFEKCADILVKTGRYEQIEWSLCNGNLHSPRDMYWVDGYSYDENNRVLTLFRLEPVDDYSDDELENNLTRAKAEPFFNQLGRFYYGSLESNEDGSPLSHLIYQLGETNSEDQFTRVEYVILTMRKRSYTLDKNDTMYDGIVFRREVIDFEMLFKLKRDNGDLVIDFTCPDFGGKPISLLAAVENQETGYSSYVGLIPGDTLANIYKEHGSRVLESNVRAFLMARNKVNRGIQETIKKNPEKFFAYNNGICATAKRIHGPRFENLVKIEKALDFQIVNGGQTTASLLYAKQKKVALHKINVPIKLTVLDESMDPNEREDFVQNIAHFANSQTTVSDSDLASNSRFQTLFAKLSRLQTTRIPNTDSYWYYERAKGSYNVEKSRAKSSAVFKKTYPHKFDKTELAKWLMAWEQHPNVCSRGAQKVFKEFASALTLKKKTDAEYKFCDDKFFQTSVGKGIMFRFIDSFVKGSRWSNENQYGSFKSYIINYTIAKLSHMIETNFGADKDFDFIKLWMNQDKWGTVYSYIPKKKEFMYKLLYWTPSTPLEQLLDRIAQSTVPVFTSTPGDPGEWVKKVECWEQVKRTEIQMTEEEREGLLEYVCDRNPNFRIP